MTFPNTAYHTIRSSLRTSLLLGAMTGLYACTGGTETAALEEGTLLHGRITGENGEPLIGIPVRARGDNATMSVVVYSDMEGRYSFPGWSDLTPGTHSVSVNLPEFSSFTPRALR